jgi:hypothetical protein
MKNTNPNFWSFSISKPLVMVCLILIFLAFVVAISIPNRVGSFQSKSNACINNLRQIDAAANQFALEHHLTNGSPINFPDDLTPYIKLNSAGKIPGCPAGGIYHLGKVGENPTCTLSTATPAHALQ